MVKRIVPFAVLAAFAALGGCDSGTPQASEQLKKDFKGAPMPADAAQRMADGLKRAQQNAHSAAESARKKASGG